ncbi:hypothetical protein [Bacteroides sp.]|uniref:hypothetical protein n=1 Tax=Bacteroides sp. TaxID=29523 RepID=UPI0026361C75|nr:hypothetical protein [Bacteroides sp.]MDD3037918.1 hypothetical protein [Bacteroides sp.]
MENSNEQKRGIKEGDWVKIISKEKIVEKLSSGEIKQLQTDSLKNCGNSYVVREIIESGNGLWYKLRGFHKEDTFIVHECWISNESPSGLIVSDDLEIRGTIGFGSTKNRVELAAKFLTEMLRGASLNDFGLKEDCFVNSAFRMADLFIEAEQNVVATNAKE